MVTMKIKANTLIETLVSLVVILLSFTMVVVFNDNLLKGNDWKIKLKAMEKVKDISKESKYQRTFFNQTYSLVDIDIQKEVAIYQNNKKLLLLSIVAKDKNGKVIYVSNEIIDTP